MNVPGFGVGVAAPRLVRSCVIQNNSNGKVNVQILYKTTDSEEDVHEENMDFQEAVRQEYIKIMSNKNCIIQSCVDNYDGHILSPEELFDSYIEDINYILTM
jgi:hypothetical protein